MYEQEVASVHETGILVMLAHARRKIPDHSTSPLFRAMKPIMVLSRSPDKAEVTVSL